VQKSRKKALVEKPLWSYLSGYYWFYYNCLDGRR